jgi:hypothetical protein
LDGITNEQAIGEQEMMVETFTSLLKQMNAVLKEGHQTKYVLLIGRKTGTPEKLEWFSKIFDTDGSEI